MEKIIEEKMERQQAEEEYHDVFDYMLSSSKEHGHQLSIQELKVPEWSTQYDSELKFEIQGKSVPASYSVYTHKMFLKGLWSKKPTKCFKSYNVAGGEHFLHH